MLHLAGCVPSLLPQLGGLDALCSCLVALTERALAAGGAWPGRRCEDAQKAPCLLPRTCR